MSDGPAVLAGRVVGADGAPVAGAAVLVAAGPVPVPDVAQLTGPDGRFALAVPVPGRYVLGVRAEGHPPADREVEVGPAAPADLEIALGRAPC